MFASLIFSYASFSNSSKSFPPTRYMINNMTEAYQAIYKLNNPNDLNLTFLFYIFGTCSLKSSLQ